MKTDTLFYEIFQTQPQLPLELLGQDGETILVYKFGSLTTKELEAMLGLSELKQTRVYQEGREEGREEAIAALLQRQFNNFSLPFALFPIMKSLILARIESIPLIMSLCEFITCYANP
jgi:predicted transposase YdaD